MKKDDYSKILSLHFASCEAEKTKFNWFAFELASEIAITVPGKLKKQLEKKGYNTPAFNRSCIALAKSLRRVVLRQLRGEIPMMRIDYTEIERAFPGLNDKMVDALLTSVGQAWDTQLAGCSICPTACVSNKDDYCTMFDDELYD
ncbi:MAG: hypothetical protein PHV59_04425 [Victivallales bacterium]|nr:hypothetical protein [Victivallales bacterium]